MQNGKLLWEFMRAGGGGVWQNYLKDSCFNRGVSPVSGGSAVVGRVLLVKLHPFGVWVALDASLACASVTRVALRCVQYDHHACVTSKVTRLLYCTQSSSSRGLISEHPRESYHPFVEVAGMTGNKFSHSDQFVFFFMALRGKKDALVFLRRNDAARRYASTSAVSFINYTAQRLSLMLKSCILRCLLFKIRRLPETTF